jgi:hypothetical protein
MITTNKPEITITKAGRAPHKSPMPAPLAEPPTYRLGQVERIAKVLEYRKICVVMNSRSFEMGFRNMHMVRDFDTVHRLTINAGDNIDALMLDSCMTLTNMDVFMRMLGPGHARSEDAHPDSAKVAVSLRKDLILFDAFEAMENGDFDKFKALLQKFRANNPNAVIVASPLHRDVFTDGKTLELNEIATLAITKNAMQQLQALLEAGLIDHIEVRKGPGHAVSNFELMHIGALLVEQKQGSIRQEATGEESGAADAAG